MQVILVLVGLVPFMVAVAGLIDGWRALGDNAIIGLRIDALLHGHLPLVGLPTTGENYGSGVSSSHPGPMALYLLAPFVLVFGHTAGLAIGAAAINSAAFVASTWAAFRRGGLFLASLTGVALCLLARGLGPYLLIDPISSNLGTFSSIAFALLAWAVLAGDRKMLPAAIIAGSFTLQAHLTYLAIGGAVLLVLVVGLAIQEFQVHRGHRRGERLSGRLLQVSVGIGVLLWAPVVIDEFFSSGNISSIIRTFTNGKQTGVGYDFAFGRLGYALGLTPLFVRSTKGLEFLTHTTTLASVTALLVLAVLVAAAFLPFRGRPIDRALKSYLAVTGTVLFVSFYSAASLPSAATIKAANLRWMWTVGMLVWLGVAWAATRIVLSYKRPKGMALVPVVVGAILLAGLAVGMQTRGHPPRDVQAKDAAAKLESAANDAKDATYRVTYQGSPALLTVGPGFAYDLASAGSKVLVDAGVFTRAYGSTNSYTDQKVAGTFVVAAGPPDSAQVQLPIDFKEVVRTDYPEQVGSNKRIEVVLGYRAGDVGRRPSFCGALTVLKDTFAPINASGSDAKAGDVATALAQLDVGQFTNLDVSADDQAQVKVLLDARDPLVALLRESPGDPIDTAFAERIVQAFPDLPASLARISTLGEQCTSDGGD